MTSEREYVNYTLKNLEETLRDAVESEATPREVYDCIINELKRTSNYHRACLNSSTKVLSLFEDNVEVNDALSSNVIPFTEKSTWPDYTELPDLNKDITINTTDNNKKDA